MFLSIFGLKMWQTADILQAYNVCVCTCICVYIVSSTDSWTIHAFLNKTLVSLAPEYPLILFKLTEWCMYCKLAAWCECYCLFFADSFCLSKESSEKGTIITNTSAISTSAASPTTNSSTTMPSLIVNVEMMLEERPAYIILPTNWDAIWSQSCLSNMWKTVSQRRDTEVLETPWGVVW